MAALGRKNSGLSMHHNHDNKDVAAPIPGFQIVIFPRFAGNSDALCFALFCKSRVGRPVPGFDRPTQLRTIRGNFIGNLRISLATLQTSMRSQLAAGTLFLVSSLSLERPTGAAAARRTRHFQIPACAAAAIIAGRL
jgi:hypothetical protein